LTWEFIEVPLYFIEWAAQQPGDRASSRRPFDFQLFAAFTADEINVQFP